MKYRLKTGVADFTVVDGAFEGRSYKAGETYEDIPPQEKHKFEAIVDPAPETTVSPKQKSGKTAADTEGGKDK